MENWSVHEAVSRDCNHNRPVYDYRKGEIACSKCGLVLQEQILESQANSDVAKPKKRRNRKK